MPTVVRDLNPSLASGKDAIVLGISIDFDVVNDNLCHLCRFRIDEMDRMVD
jgi:hypothetical protein